MNEYTKAFTQLSYIIARMDKDIKEKIPLNVRKSISQKKDNRYIFSYNKTLPLYRQKLLPETKSLLSVIYSEYICSKEEKEKWDEYDKFKQKKTDKRLAEYQKQTKEEYNVEKLFNKNKENKVNTTDNNKSFELVEVKDSIFKKIWNKILKIFIK